MTRGSSYFAVSVLGLVAACGGSTAVDPDTGGGTGAGGGGVATGGSAGRLDAGPDVAVEDASTALDVWSTYVPPDCPDLPDLPVLEECELFAADGACPAGTGCLPYVEYPPEDELCGREQYGTACQTVGSGAQGEPCEYGTCAAGSLCVLTGEGTQCVGLCDTLGADSCPPGLFCEPIDVQAGIGGCY